MRKRIRGDSPGSQWRPYEFGLAAVLTGLVLLACTLWSSKPLGADFATLYVGGRMVVQGNGSRLYDVNEQARVYQQVLGVPSPLVDPYPPYDAALFAPIAKLDYRTAFIVWAVVNILLWLFSIYLLRGCADSISPPKYLGLCALYAPMLVALILGQMSLVLLTVFALTYVFLRRGQEYRAGISLGLGLLKFQIVLPFALIFLCKRKWKALAGFSTVGIVLGLLSVIVIGVSGVRDYVKLLVDILRHPANPAYQSIHPLLMPTIRGFVTGVLSGHVPQGWITALWTGLSVGLILLMAKLWTSDCDFELMYASMLVVSLLTAAHLHPYDLTPALVAVVLTLASPRWRDRSIARTLLTFAIGALYASMFYFSFLIQQQSFFLLAPVLVIFALGTLALARQGRHSSPSEDSCALRSDADGPFLVNAASPSD